GPNKMGGLEHALAPPAQELAVAVKGHDRHGFVAMKNVDVVVRVDIYTGRRAPLGNARRKLRPILDQFVVALLRLGAGGLDGSQRPYRDGNCAHGGSILESAGHALSLEICAIDYHRIICDPALGERLPANPRELPGSKRGRGQSRYFDKPSTSPKLDARAYLGRPLY